MKGAIEDFPASESVSRLRALGVITKQMAVTTIAFGEVSFNVDVAHRQFPNGGSWSFFLCPCGRRARILRLHEGALACCRCLGSCGLRPRVELVATPNRAAYLAPILARLNSTTPARLHPRPGRMLDRRASLEAKLRRSLIVARQHALDEHDKMLAKPLEDK